MGRGYVIDHCISTLKREKQKEAEDKVFRIYVTDTLMNIAENTTHFVGAKEMFDYGKSMSKRWIEIMDGITGDTPPEKPQEEDHRTAGEFAADLWSRIRKKR